MKLRRRKATSPRLRKSLAVLAGIAAALAAVVALHATGAGADVPRNSQHIPCPHPAALAPPVWT
ncbi:hypothetical protein [Nocardia sp. NBC_01327]|uniref:hypothetical protein n=1 Tax=Nocardia sp. NBC_01327 TaxID=2903593 RepID=UPI002E14FBBB|nr:hypothetical protein OG326_03675 [Nocardia sp. NBC_01327]